MDEIVEKSKSAAEHQENGEKQEQKEQKSPVGCKKWTLLITVSATFVVGGVIYSIPPAYYPTEAEDRGIEASQYGFVFGISSLTAAVSALLFAVVSQRIGAKWIFVCGMLTQSVAGGLIFGTLEAVSNGTTFLVLSYVLRALFGVADAAAYVSSSSLMIALWPENFSTMFSAVQTCFGFGYAVGPYLGSLLYEVGGFDLAFYVFGGIGVFLSVGNIFVVPEVKVVKLPEKDESETEGKKSLTLMSVLKTPSVWFPIFDNFVFVWGSGFLEGMLEPFAKDEAGMTQHEVGLTFLIVGSVYMFFSPVFGILCDRYKSFDSTMYSIVANALAFVAFVFVGPITFVDLDPSVTLVYSSAAVYGLASALIMVSTITRAQRGVMDEGYADDINTYLIVSGSWTFSFYAGNFLGPTVGGFLVEIYDFQSALVLYLALYALMLVADTLEWLRHVCKI